MSDAERYENVSFRNVAHVAVAHGNPIFTMLVCGKSLHGYECP
jgi:hypothetical protein